MKTMNKKKKQEQQYDKNEVYSVDWINLLGGWLFLSPLQKIIQLYHDK